MLIDVFLEYVLLKSIYIEHITHKLDRNYNYDTGFEENILDLVREQWFHQGDQKRLE